MNPNVDATNTNPPMTAAMIDDTSIDIQRHSGFSSGITDLYVTMEDLRQSLRSIERNSAQSHPNDYSVRITIDTLQDWQSHIDRIVQIMYYLLQLVSTKEAKTAFVEEMEMLQHSMAKALDVTKSVLQLCCSQYTEPTQDDDTDATTASMEEQRRVGQGCVARIAEMNIILSFHLLQISSSAPLSAGGAGDTKDKSDFSNTPMEEIVQLYVQFQRRTFRSRCKPSIAQLVDLRCQQKLFTVTVFHQAAENNPEKTRNTTSVGMTPESIHPQLSLNMAKTYDDDDDEEGVTTLVNISNIHQSKEIQLLTQQEQRHKLLLKHYHAPVFTIVLGVAATLIHPLAAWMAHVVPSIDRTKNSELSIPSIVNRLCTQAIYVIHEQTEALIKSVAEWFYQDRKYIFDLLSSSDDPLMSPTTSIFNMKREQQIGQLTAVVDEMAYIAQILERYVSLIDSCFSDEDAIPVTKINMIATAILPEWIWQYSALERRLVLQQWQMSVVPTQGSTIRATAVCIVIGTEIRVSSCVEDAQYITSRAMDRAASTQSLHVIATIAYAIAHDIWSTEAIQDVTSRSMSVYQALLEEIGCWSELELDGTSLTDGTDSKSKSNVTSPSSGGGFAAALLDALDEDMEQPHVTSFKKAASTTTSPSKPPLSGGTSFLSSLMSSSTVAVGNEKSDQRQLDTLFCVFNSIYAASGACRSLVNTLDDILSDYGEQHCNDSNVKTNDTAPPREYVSVSASPLTSSQSEMTKKAVALIHLARDELLQYSGQYQELLFNRINESIRLWCYGSFILGSHVKRNQWCLDALHDFFVNENYDIDGTTFASMEADERLEDEILNPLKQSSLLQQMTYKCETPVVQIISERLATFVVDMLLEILWKSKLMDDNDKTVVNSDMKVHHSKNVIFEKRFTEWGALLLSKQSRILQHYISTTLTQGSKSTTTADTSYTSATSLTATMSVFQIWERLSQVVTILQLEKPVDWLIYHSTSKLTPDEVSRTMRLRIDFSSDAIEKVVASVRAAPETSNPKA